jgi:hypothetical protein
MKEKEQARKMYWTGVEHKKICKDLNITYHRMQDFIVDFVEEKRAELNNEKTRIDYIRGVESELFIEIEKPLNEQNKKYLNDLSLIYSTYVV